MFTHTHTHTYTYTHKYTYTHSVREKKRKKESGRDGGTGQRERKRAGIFFLDSSSKNHQQCRGDNWMNTQIGQKETNLFYWHNEKIIVKESEDEWWPYLKRIKVEVRNVSQEALTFSGKRRKKKRQGYKKKAVGWSVGASRQGGGPRRTCAFDALKHKTLENHARVRDGHKKHA